jgi:hypothetical protein
MGTVFLGFGKAHLLLPRCPWMRIVNISLIMVGTLCTSMSHMLHKIKALFVRSRRKLGFPKEKQLAPKVANRLLLN